MVLLLSASAGCTANLSGVPDGRDDGGAGAAGLGGNVEPDRCELPDACCSDAACCRAGETCEPGAELDCASGTYRRTPGAACEPWTTCGAGTFVVEQGSASSDRVCAPCASDTFASTENAEACLPFTHCEAGTFVASPGSPVSDRSCSGCPSGTFTDTADRTDCSFWSDCSPGEEVAEDGSDSMDRVCAPCGPGTFSAEPNSGECQPQGVCLAGTELLSDANTAPVVCQACPTGSYCAGGSTPRESCGEGMWDHDGSAASACVARTQCVPGEFVTDFGSPTSDRGCASCATGYTDAPNQPACEAWSNCAAGTFRATPGTATSDTVCVACDSGFFSATSNASACTPLSVCPAGTRIFEPGGPTSDRTCAACEGETFSDEANSSVCSAQTVCSPGSRVLEEGTAASEQTCAPCVEGTFSAVDDAPACASWTSCGPDRFVSGAGSATVDRACARCVAGTNTVMSNASNCTAVTVAALVTGMTHTCALLSDGAVRCFGWGIPGQLGYGSQTTVGDDETPFARGSVPVGGRVTQLVAGVEHTCALLDSGAVRCWGDNRYGAVGTGNPARIGDDETPASVGDINVGGTVTALAAGRFHTCALLTTGNVRCWGANTEGSLGYGHGAAVGDDEAPSSAGDVPIGDSVTLLAAGGNRTCVVTSSGGLKCWGAGFGLGYGNTTTIGDDETPASVGNVDVGGTPIEIAMSQFSTCVRFAAGNVRCWGDGALTGYGTGATIGDNETPASAGDVPMGGTVASLHAGDLHTCARYVSGAVRCWGLGDGGALGTASTQTLGDDETVSSLADIALGASAVLLSRGVGSHSCAVLETGDVRCWGPNAHRQLGRPEAPTSPVGDDETPGSVGLTLVH